MTFKLEKSTQAKARLRVVSVNDTGIDWEASYPEVEATEDQSALVRKRIVHQQVYDLSKVVAKEGEALMYFEFEHPRRVDMYRKMQAAVTESQVQMNGLRQNGRGQNHDLFAAVLNATFIGHTENPSEQAPAEERGKDGKLTLDFIQTLIDLDLYGELANVVLQFWNEAKPSSEKK
jgi:hypothetical protein